MKPPIRLAFWILALFFCSVKTWYTRHRIFSDGISYLEIAKQYAAGDWHGALNAYWSPLYSWAIALYLALFQPSDYWEASALHAINFAVFLAACWVYERLVQDLIRTRPADWNGLSPETLTIAGYAAILHAGVLMVGTAYVSPDMLGFLFAGIAAWMLVRLADGRVRVVELAAFGAALGAGYLSRTAFLGFAFACLIAAWFLPAIKIRRLFVATACFVAVASPFVVALSLKQGAFTLGESGKLNYGWEVNRAARWTHWQGEPGDMGTPVHPTRLVLTEPVPVYEFARPGAGSYPPWYDPSYWYKGIRPRFDGERQTKIFLLNCASTAFNLASSPIIWIVFALLALTKGRAIQTANWPSVYWGLIATSAIAVLLYCLVFAEKRYIGAYVLIGPYMLLAGMNPQSRHANAAARLFSGFFVALLLWWLRPQISACVDDLIHHREGEANVSWMMARGFREIGVKPGDRVAYVGNGLEADWARIAGAVVVAEVPVIHSRSNSINRREEADESNTARFFSLDEASREKVYRAFRSAGAVIAVTRDIPPKGDPGDWKRLLDPRGPQYPTLDTQLLLQSPGYYRWLKK